MKSVINIINTARCIEMSASRQPIQLRSSSSNPLFISSVETNVGTRTFSVFAPLWNSLLVSVKSAGNVITFNCQLKTHLFKLTYPPQVLSVHIQLFSIGFANQNCLTLLFWCVDELGFLRIVAIAIEVSLYIFGHSCLNYIIFIRFFNCKCVT